MRAAATRCAVLAQADVAGRTSRMAILAVMADYSADWCDDEYERPFARTRFNDEQKRQFRIRPDE